VKGAGERGESERERQLMQHAKWCVRKESRLGFCLPPGTLPTPTWPPLSYHPLRSPASG